ncbi:hypothetical protein [Brachybacterium sp. P6-10-X1]|uniref:hypothetical protein n=1 Tax=Brachybacterium sp. P6-10-X1 TaxID=1903186 RepID=UPI0020A447D2|nr:hypothetical protein [Brachybacterium sp. P6-10-X1]
MEQVFRRDGEVVADAVVRARFLRRSGGSVPMEEVLDLAGPVPDHRQLPEWVAQWNEGSSRHGREL